jgi:alpha-tubulin suppressor-like RCC1 family protein
MRSTLVVLLALGACSNPEISGTTCTSDADCNLFAATGTCEPTGFCSYPDASCVGGKRYSPGAGSSLGNTCIGGDPACGAKDQTCCGAGACGPDLICSGEGGTCQCGGVGQPCCDGTSCSTGLACDANATCKTPMAFTQVAVGKYQVCALASDRTVWCWGFDATWNTDVPGQKSPTLPGLTPTQVAGVTDVVEIRGGEFHTCARKSDNTLWCWGHNEHGQLGNGTTTSSAAATQVPGLGAVQHFDAGTFHTCAIGSYNGAPGVWCWGRGGKGGMGAKPIDATQGRLGNNATADSSVPVAVDLTVAAAAGQTVKWVSAGDFHSCMVMSDNTVWCWGRGASGELGNGATANSKAPVKVDFTGITIPNGVTVDQVSCSDGKHAGSSCMLLSNGTIHCWGNDTLGELGDATTAGQTRPVTKVATDYIPAKIVELASAMSARCARAADGSVWCWGENKKGFHGTGLSSNPTSKPGASLMTGATQIDASHRTACAIDGMNRLYCWGNNQRGQITLHAPADAVETNVLAPLQVIVP